MGEIRPGVFGATAGDGGAKPGGFRLRDPSGALCLSLDGQTPGAPAGGAGWPAIRSLPVCQGVSLHTAVFNFSQASEFAFEIDDQDLHFSFCTAGLALTDLHLAGRRLRGLPQAPAVFHASYLPQAQGVWRPRAGTCQILTLSVSREAFDPIRRECQVHGPGPVCALDERAQPFFLAAPATPAIRIATHCLEQALRAQPAIELLLQCKALELLILTTLQLCRRRGGQERNDIPLTRRDQDNLHCAREILLADLAEPPSLTQLARRAGVNEFKLKRGFRQLFGTTPYACLREARLEQARRLLEAGGMGVCEVCLAVGYSNPGHFIGLFKKRFGVTPGGVRQCALRAVRGGREGGRAMPA